MVRVEGKLSERVRHSWEGGNVKEGGREGGREKTKRERVKKKRKRSTGETAEQKGKFLSAICSNHTVINPRLCMV